MTTPRDPYRQGAHRHSNGQPPREPYYPEPPSYPEPPASQPYYQQPQPGQGYYPPPPQQPYYPPAAQAQQPPTKRKRRIFLWVFLAVQVLFIIWIIAAIATKPGGQTVASQVAQTCRNGGWQGLFKSQADCTKHYAVALNDATDTGKGLGVALIVVMWVVVDFFLGLGYGIYKLATR